jgi:hypothetical protein
VGYGPSQTFRCSQPGDAYLYRAIEGFIAITIFIGGALFALRLRPGSAFTLGAVATSVVILAVRHEWTVYGLSSTCPSCTDWIRLYFLESSPARPGWRFAIHAVRITEVADVNAILRAASPESQHRERENVSAGRGKTVGVRCPPSPIATTRREIR